MLLCEKKKDYINIYKLEEDEEKARTYREKVLFKAKNLPPCFYYLIANTDHPAHLLFNHSSIDLEELEHEYSYSSEEFEWTKIRRCQLPLTKEQEDIIHKYIEGKYNNLSPTRVTSFALKKGRITEPYHFLMPEKPVTIDSQIDKSRYYVVNNMLDLPYPLYLLSLFEHGKYEDLKDKRIDNIIEIFDINYVKSFKISDIAYLLQAIDSSEKLPDIITKAKIGAKVLKRMKK